jgi:glutamate N-acetyltransferase/amino-acid N-acetyltransferase
MAMAHEFHGQENLRGGAMSDGIPAGWSMSGVACGIRGSSGEPGRLDLAVWHSDRPASAAGVFTKNLVFAAPVAVCRQRLHGGHGHGFQAVVASSGNANACTGERGLADALEMTGAVEKRLGLSEGTALVANTGVIGRFLPMEVIRPGIDQACQAADRRPQSVENASRAIMTTDTRPKVSRRQVSLSTGETVHILGMAKGAAMIAPDMATMLSFLFTDAPVSPGVLHALLRRSSARTFNCLSIDGHMSTNDTVLLLANGAARPGQELHGPDLEHFAQAVEEVSADLAGAIAGDAEGATKLVYVEVEGMRKESEARQIARAVADSPLVKTAIYGADPNWGRIVSAAGYAGVPFDPSALALDLNGKVLYEKGSPTAFDSGEISRFMRETNPLVFRLTFQEGSQGCRLASCDLTPEYVRLNSDYTT